MCLNCNLANMTPEERLTALRKAQAVIEQIEAEEAGVPYVPSPEDAPIEVTLPIGGGFWGQDPATKQIEFFMYGENSLDSGASEVYSDGD